MLPRNLMVMSLFNVEVEHFTLTTRCVAAYDSLVILCVQQALHSRAMHIMKRFINVDECGVNNETESVQNAIKTVLSAALTARAFSKNQKNNATVFLVSEFSTDELRLNFICRATLKISSSFSHDLKLLLLLCY